MVDIAEAPYQAKRDQLTFGATMLILVFSDIKILNSLANLSGNPLIIVLPPDK